MRKSLLVLVVMALLGPFMLGCPDSTTNEAQIWEVLNPEQRALIETNARGIATLPPFSLVEFKDGTIWVLCGSRYIESPRPTVRVRHHVGLGQFGEPLQADDACLIVVRDPTRLDGLGGDMKASTLLSVKAVAPFDQNDPYYRTLSSRMFYEFWNSQVIEIKPDPDSNPF